jgi:2-polyprenyl-3-methyl-5-hydroxy-6-metoxy-1,4-benzoquinol methylase
MKDVGKHDKIVKDWYSSHASTEWRRLQQDPYHRIEFIITNHFLKKYLPNRGTILDAGGGPGRYSIELARQGYSIVLLDLVPEMLETARKKMRREGVLRKVRQFVQGSVEDLSAFSNGSFDAVLCLGAPLNHLLEAKQREKAAEELVRVAKKNAPIFVSVISRIGLLKTILANFPHEMRYAKHHWEVGDYVPGLQGEGFTAAHWFLPEELRELFERRGVQVLEMAGLEGLSSHLQKETNRLYRDREKWSMWAEILLDTCAHPSVVGNAEHFLLVGKKQG